MSSMLESEYARCRGSLCWTREALGEEGKSRGEVMVMLKVRMFQSSPLAEAGGRGKRANADF